MTIGKKIKQLRQEHSLSQEELADKLLVSRQAITKWETERGLPDISNIKAIAKMFQLSLDDLLNDDVESFLQMRQVVINYSAYKKNHRRGTSIYHEIALDQYPLAEEIYFLWREKKLSILERIVDTFILGAGALDLLDMFSRFRSNYLVRQGNKLLFSEITRETVTTLVLPFEKIEKDFVFQGFRYRPANRIL